MYECLHMVTPFLGDGDEEEILANISDAAFAVDFGDCSPSARSMMSGLLRRNASIRFGVSQVRRHAFFEGLDWRALAHQKLDTPFSPYIKNEFDMKYFSNADAMASLKMIQMKTEPYMASGDPSPLWKKLNPTPDERQQLREDPCWDAEF